MNLWMWTFPITANPPYVPTDTTFKLVCFLRTPACLTGTQRGDHIGIIQEQRRSGDQRRRSRVARRMVHRIANLIPGLQISAPSISICALSGRTSHPFALPGLGCVPSRRTALVAGTSGCCPELSPLRRSRQFLAYFVNPALHQGKVGEVLASRRK